jgi:hypothetical protein
VFLVSRNLETKRYSRRKAYPERTSKFLRRTLKKLPVPDPISVRKTKTITMLFNFFVSVLYYKK